MPLPRASIASADDEPPVRPDVREPESLQHLAILQLQAGLRATRLWHTAAAMTFSIVARSTDGESWGVAVASKFLAVGAVVPAAVAGVGAIATQADANVAYKGLALSHLDEGATASVALQRLLEEDDGRDDRQVGIVDVDGGAASHTGHACLDWAGGVTGRTGTPSRATSWPVTSSSPPCRTPSRRATPTSRWPAACSPRSRPATTPAVTGADASRRHSSSSATVPGTPAATTSPSTSGSTTTPTRSPSWPACSTSTTST